MATPKRLNFSSSGGCDPENNSPPSRSKSLRNPASKHASSDTAANDEPSKKKRKRNKLASPLLSRIWSEDDELAVLKGLVDYRVKMRLNPRSDWDAFTDFILGSIHAKVSKEELLSKIRKLKKKFRANMEKINEGSDPLFTKSSDSLAFGFSMLVWGKNKAVFSNGDMNKPQLRESGEEMFKKDEQVADAEHLNGNGAAKCNIDDKITENGTVGKENHDADELRTVNDGKSLDEVVVNQMRENKTLGKEKHDDDDNELCAVRDAFETMVSKGYTDYQKKLMLERLMNLESAKRKELSNEWKALCVEEGKLYFKKLRFFANLVKAANDYKEAIAASN